MRSYALILAVAINACAVDAHAQSAREQAVAIDRVPIPPLDMWEVERVGPVLNFPWSIAFLPDGRMLVTEKHGGIRLIARNGAASGPLSGGPPNVLQRSDSGLLDVVLDPDFTTNGLVYVAFAEGTEAANRTAIWRARLDDDRLVEGRVIFRVNDAKSGVGHPGGRMLFLPDNTLLLTVGDGYDLRDRAQDPASHLGKVLRLTRDGAAARDNPFVSHPGYAPEIWTLGHRNIQGLARDPVTGTIWSHEHGPRGGDEINVLRPGRNYGWPRTSNGIDYDGTVITERAHQAGIESPLLVWSPSIAPSGLAIYRGPLFPELEGRLLVGTLVALGVVQVRINPDNDLLAEEARRLTDLRLRIRDVRVAPDGNIYWLSDIAQGGLFRVIPFGERLASARSGHDHSVRALAFLLGTWTGESRQHRAGVPEASPIVSTSRTFCRPALRGTAIECLTTFITAEGRSREVSQFYAYDPRTRRIETRVQASNWGGLANYAIEWDEAARTWTGLQEFTDEQGRPMIERVTMRLSADSREIEQIEELRPARGGAWNETLRWTLRRSQ